MKLRDLLREQVKRLADKAKQAVKSTPQRAAKLVTRLAKKAASVIDYATGESQRRRDTEERLKEVLAHQRELERKVTRYERLMGPMKSIKTDLPKEMSPIELESMKDTIRRAIRKYSNPEDIADSGMPAYRDIAIDFGVEARDVYELFFY